MSERAFVSGGAGVIGSALIDQLLEMGWTVFTGDLKPCPKRWVGKLSYYHGDLNSLTKKELLDFSPSFYFHLAATFERSYETPSFWGENFHHNVRLSHHLIDLVKACTNVKKVIFASSYLIYDPKHYLFDTPQNKPVRLSERATIAPRNLCGAAKRFHEEELHFLHSSFPKEFRFVSARIFRSFGKGSRDVISRFIMSLLKGESITVYQPEGRFDFIFADDVARGLILLAENQHEGIYNLGSGKARTIQDILSLLLGHFPKAVIHFAEPKDLYESSEADMTAFQKVTGWLPPHTIETAIPKIIDFNS